MVASVLIKQLETAEGNKVRVFQWLMVPYWLLEELIGEGELVLRVYGNNWWGITSQTKALDDIGNLFQDLFSQI